MGFASLMLSAQGTIRFDSKPFHQGTADWKMAKFKLHIQELCQKNIIVL